jgi:uncharacterized protein involved in exopolysaccharide biosynthesis
VLVPALGVSALAVAASMVLPERYQAFAILAVQSETALTERRAKLIAERLLRRSRLEQVAGETGAGDLSRAFRVRLAGPDSLRLECVRPDPGAAAHAANRVAALFVEGADAERRLAAAGGIEDLESRLAAARQDLEEKEAAVLRRSPASASGTATAPSSSERQLKIERQAITGKLLALQARASILRAEVEQERSRLTERDRPSPELEQLRARLAELRRRYTDRYPDVQAVLRRIEQVEAAEAARPRAVPTPSAAQVELGDLERQIEELQRRGDAIDAQIASSRGGPEPRKEAAETAVPSASELEAARDTYVSLLRQWTDAQAATRTEPDGPHERYSVRQAAVVPSRPVFPNRLAFGLGGLAGGLLLGLGLALAREHFDPSVKDPEDVEELLSAPLLAVLPEITQSEPREAP